ncbi:hypothetical protein [Aeromonas veronii]|uniref:hypothetical protein n=1 Tax=Aeromonas veronii TaxID=654 RepID=UPI0022481D09|nr:hypothetical protein [Aeromonas veronii]MCX0437838.1 hypothetical protein [Aeromonas veronii]
MKIIFHARLFFLLYVFFTAFIPMGSVTGGKTFLLAMTLFFFLVYILSENIKISINKVWPFLLILSVFVFYTMLTLVSLKKDGGAITLLSSLTSMLIVIFIGLFFVSTNVVNVISLYNSIVFGLALYAISKFAVTFSIYFSLISLDTLKIYFPDLGSLGYIGIKGWHRLASVNDFIFPFIYFFIDRTTLKHKRIIKFIFVFSMFMSFTRSIWLVFIVLSLLKSVQSIKNVMQISFGMFLLVFLFIAIEQLTGANFTQSIIHRLFDEGNASINEKNNQIFVLLNELSNYAWFGKGLGTYVEDYIRNDRLKYGYEAAWFVYALHFGVPITLMLIMSILSPIFIYGTLFDSISIVFFLLMGLTNPVVIGALPALLYLIYYCTLDKRKGGGC